MSGFLAEASRVLAESVGYEDTLATVAGMALPQLGSWCIVDVIEPDGSPRRVRIVHTDADLQVHARALEASWPPERDDPLGVPRVARTRRTEIISEVTDDLLASVARNGENLRHLRALSIGSAMTVPLLVHDEVLGAVTYVSPDAGHPYEPGVVELAEDLASRCATALRRARLQSLAEESRRASAEMNERLIVASLRDRDLAEAALRANDAKSRFITAMSHEFRSPLAAIGMYARLISEGKAGQVTDRQRKHLHSIDVATQHLNRLLVDILDLATLEAGQTPIRSRPGPMTEPVAEAIAMLEAEAAAVGVAVETGPRPTGPCRYEGDPDRTRQILLNLLTNALHFTPRGGRVTVTYGDSATADEGAHLPGRGPWVFVTVQDTGPGIDDGEADILFEPFVQGKAGRAWGGGGTGLGLSISRQLARRMNGDLTLQSTQGEGSAFTLWLPAAAAH